MMLPWPEETIQLAEAWLAEQNFDKDPQASSLWNRDPVATRDCLLQEKEKEKLELLAANQQLNSDCEATREEKDILAAKLELLSTQWQELRQIQAHTLSKIQQSQTEAESLKSLQEALQQECQQLTYEKSELQRKLQTEEATNLNNIEAVKNLFPLQHYKEISSDLGDLDEDQMVLHYLQHGRHEIRLKTYLELDNELKSCFKQREEAEAKVKLLETQFDLVKQHLENMKDLFARLADRPQSLQQITEE
jgi:chromosome segregation ATPase